MRRHESGFNLKKYDLIHFSRTLKRFNMKAALCVTDTEIPSKDEVCILRVILDPALRWNAQLQTVEVKAVQQLNALRSLTGSTWGSSIKVMRRVYTAIIRPTLTFRCNAWYTPSGIPDHRKRFMNKLQVI